MGENTVLSTLESYARLKNESAVATRARITVENGQAHLIPMQWFKLLLRLRQLDEGCHSVTLIKSGESVSWAVHSAKVEG